MRISESPNICCLLPSIRCQHKSCPLVIALTLAITYFLSDFRWINIKIHTHQRQWTTWTACFIFGTLAMPAKRMVYCITKFTQIGANKIFKIQKKRRSFWKSCLGVKRNVCKHFWVWREKNGDIPIKRCYWPVVKTNELPENERKRNEKIFKFHLRSFYSIFNSFQLDLEKALSVKTNKLNIKYNRLSWKIIIYSVNFFIHCFRVNDNIFLCPSAQYTECYTPTNYNSV